MLLYLLSESSLKIWYVTFCLMLYILSCVRTLFQMLHTRTNMQFYSRLPVNVNTSPLPTEGNTGWDVRERGSNMNKTLTHYMSLNATSEFYWQRWLLTIKTTAPMFLHAPSQHHQFRLLWLFWSREPSWQKWLTVHLEGYFDLFWWNTLNTNMA